MGVALVILLAWLIGRSFKSSFTAAGPVQETVTEFLRAVAAGDFPKAYALTSKDFRARNPEGYFQGTMKEAQALFSGVTGQRMSQFQAHMNSDSPPLYDYEGVIDYADAAEGEGRVQAILVEEGGDIKIYGITALPSKERWETFQKSSATSSKEAEEDPLSMDFASIHPFPAAHAVDKSAESVKPSSIELVNQLESQIKIPLTGSAYVTASPGEDIVKYYDGELGRNGWKYACVKPLRDWGKDLGGWQRIYLKNGYLAALEYAGEKADFGWTYALDLTWSGPGEACPQGN